MSSGLYTSRDKVLGLISVRLLLSQGHKFRVTTKEK